MILPADLPTRAQLERLLAARDPSSVTTVQPSASSTARAPPRVIIGSIASAIPARSRGPVPGLP